MKAIFVNQGNYLLKQVHEPWVTANGVKVRLKYSSVSFGTEGNTRSGQTIKRILFSRERWQKAAALLKSSGRPLELWKKFTNLKKVNEPVGYSAVGIVMEVGRRVDSSLKVGDWVHVGGELASHQEIVCVPQNFVFKLGFIPEPYEAQWLSVATILSVPYHAVQHALEGFKMPTDRAPRALIVGGGIIGTFAGLFLQSRFSVELFDLSSQVMADQFFSRTSPQSQYDLIVYSTPSMQGADTFIGRCFEGAILSVIGETSLLADRSILEDKLMTIRFCKSFGYGRGNKAYEEGLIRVDDRRFPWTMRRNISDTLLHIRSKILGDAAFEKLINLVDPQRIELDRSQINVFNWNCL